MPTRQLPNTDAGRIKVLEAAKAKADTTDPAKWAISPETKALIDEQLPLFKKEVQERGSALSDQTQASAEEDAAMALAHTHISHFIQVFNFGVTRGVHQAGERAHFQLPVNKPMVPALVTEEDVVLWGKRIINGEAARTAAGGTPMANPSAGDVQAAQTPFLALHSAQSTKKDTYDKEQEDVQNMRPGIDELALDVYDQVEFFFRKDDPPSLRRKAREWGLVYIPLPGEEPEEDTPPAEPETPA